MLLCKKLFYGSKPLNPLMPSLPALLFAALLLATALPAFAQRPPFPADPLQSRERTSFQTSRPWSGAGNLRSDVAMVYGIGPDLPERIATWRAAGYRIHVMTGISWGGYQDYLYGRYDGINHEDEAQTDVNGNKIGHGGDVYYMCPGTNYGKYICVGVQRALDAGAEAIHLEEPEFWVRAGWSGGFQREWRNYYGEAWQPPNSSVDASWRAAKLKYFLYRRALQQVFDYVQDYNRKSGRHVRCYVPTHSLLNYAQWGIVSPESSLARLNGCDGYIAQVWTGTSRTPNLFRGEERERTFETAFLEYGAMQNLVRATARKVWYLNDPIEDNPNHDWADYKRNWESTLVASLLQPEVSSYEVAPWPERIFNGRYPRSARRADRQGIPDAYATELQIVMNALNDLDQTKVEWNAGTRGVGVLISDSLMFERGDPRPSEAHLGCFYSLALPLVKRGLPVTPVQLENVTIPHFLDGIRVLLLTYHGMKPLSAEVHAPLVQWVKAGGALAVVDNDSDDFNQVREWWNTNGNHFTTPRQHLFAELGVGDENFTNELASVKVGKGAVFWQRYNPAVLTYNAAGAERIVELTRHAAAAAGLKWSETNHLMLRRGPYLVASTLDESVSTNALTLAGRFVSLFDAELRVQKTISIPPGHRQFLLDLDAIHPKEAQVLASACKALPVKQDSKSLTLAVEGVADTTAKLLLFVPKHAPKSITLDGQVLATREYSEADKLLWITFENETRPRELKINF
jgi:hypothetical protein